MKLVCLVSTGIRSDRVGPPRPTVPKSQISRTTAVSASRKVEIVADDPGSSGISASTKRRRMSRWASESVRSLIRISGPTPGREASAMF